MGADFDGDCIGVAEASRYPNLALAIQETNQPENLFRPTRKEAKVSFPEGTTFEEMAIHMADGISVGSINNAVTSFEASLSELELYEKYGSLKLQETLAESLISQAQWVLNQEQAEKPIQVPEPLRDRFVSISEMGQQILTPDAIAHIFNEQKQVYRWMVEEGCYQNQIAVDLFKSAKTADTQSIKNLTKFLPQTVDYFKTKKEYSTYRNKPLETKGNSPVEITAALVNSHFQENQLTPQSPLQFKNWCPADYTPQQKLVAIAVKASYDEVYNRATAYNKKLKIESGPVLKVEGISDQPIFITNYKYFLNHREAQKLAQSPLTIKFVPNNQGQTRDTHQLLAQYQAQDGQWHNLGTVCEVDRQKLNLTTGKTFQVKAQLAQALSEKQVNLMFDEARQLATDWRQTLEQENRRELPQYFHATWQLCHNHEREDTSNNFIYATFGDLILERLAQPQMQINNYLVGKLRDFQRINYSRGM